MPPEKLKDFLQLIKNSSSIKSEELLEKDFYITILLHALKKNGIENDLIFKGGTCLSKVYLDYHRLSEDIDFNWKNRQEFENLSANKIKKFCSLKITQFGKALEQIANSTALDFKSEKSNKHYIQLSSNGKQATFKVWYISVFGEGIQSFIKIQISFIEPAILPPKKTELKSFFAVNKLKHEERIYFQELLKSYDTIHDYYVFDIREIFAEKIRALLTRRKIKSRDLLDIYLITKKYNIKLNDIHEECRHKLLFAIKNYAKYKENFDAITAVDLTKDRILVDDFTNMLIGELNMHDFNKFTDSFLKEINIFINQIKQEVLA